MDLDREMSREAWKQYFHYFRFWLAGAAVMALIAIAVNVGRGLMRHESRGNLQAPAERVYDYADVLTDGEEAELRDLIADLEGKCHADLVLVTLCEPMGTSDYDWEANMMNRADDFYDDGAYGWNRAYGDGALLLDNWYEDVQGSQKGSWLSTSGRMERIIGASEEGRVLDAMDRYIDADPYKAYRAALSKLADYGKASGDAAGLYREGRAASVLGAVVISTIAALAYALTHLRQPQAKNTTTATTYVANGRPVIRAKSDDFIRKSVVSQRIETNSGGSGSHHSGGGSHGSHVSSGGHSHGGGGRRR